MSNMDGVWMGKQLPKNIRQVGETGEQNRIYLEDYVYTYVRKALENRDAQVVCGFLIGTWEDLEQGRYYFVKSALTAEGLLSARECRIMGTPLWKKNRELAEYYFPGQQILGWFMRCREDGLYEEADIRKMHENIFPDENGLLYLRQEEEQQMYFGAGREPEKISGYYIYFEKNQDMQQYMSGGQSASEEPRTRDDAIERYRTIMQERRDEKGRKQEVLLRRLCIGLSAAVLFLSAYTWYAQYQRKQFSPAVLQEPEPIEAAATVGMTESNPETAQLFAEESASDSTDNTESVEIAQRDETDIREPETEPGVLSQIESAAEHPAAEAVAGVQNPGMHYYEVHSGDTLVSICLSLYGTTDVLPAVCELNGIENPALIYNGQKIYLP